MRSLQTLCAENEADLLLIAGDLFDNPYPAQGLADFVADCLAQLVDVQVCIAPGNHDPLLPESVWETTRWPSNVHIFTGDRQRFAFDSPDVCVEGAAYTAYHADAPLFVPSGEPFDGFRILLWHGDIGGGASRYNALDPHSRFLSDYDYIAMGHVHNAVAANGLPAYPGFVLGRGYDETGAGGIRFAELTEKGAVTKMLPVPGLRFEILAVEVTGAQSTEEMLARIDAAIAEAAGAEDPDRWLQNTALRLMLTGQLSDEIEMNTDILESRLLLKRPQELSVRDRTRTAFDLHEVAEESGLRGIMARNLLDRMESRDDSTLFFRAFDLLIRAERKESLRYED